MTFIDKLLNRLTMYRLTLYYLIALVALGLVLSAVGLVPARPEAIAATTAILLAVCFLSNMAIAALFRIRSNPESTLITSLILALILEPVWPLANPRGALVVALAGVVGIASKYLLAIRRQHLFNPAAVAALFSGLAFGAYASWWVGNPSILPLVAVGGLLLARKVSRLRLVGVFLLEFLVFSSGLALANGLGPDMILQSAVFVLTQSSAVFFAVVMLTEPMTSPKRFGLQTVYAGIVALLYQPQLAILGHNLTPEQALMIGNVFSYVVSPGYKLRLPLAERRDLGGGIVSFTYPKPRWFRHRPGQYMEWSLPLHSPDTGGTRRYLSLASSPTESEIMIAARFPENPSSFKRALLARPRGSLITAGELSGDFTLPRDSKQPLAFVAGGIGITPFRSMVKYLLDTGETRDIVLLYAANTEEELAFREIFDEAKARLGLKVTYVLSDTSRIRSSWCGRRGFVTADMVREEVPDAARRLFFVSGPPAMVNAMKGVLHAAGVHRSAIRTDAFSGYAA